MQNETILAVTSVLYKGQQNILKNSHAINIRPNPDYFGALTCTIEGYVCPRCRKSSGFLFVEKAGPMYFCGTSSCLSDDKRASLAIKHATPKSDNREASREFGLGAKYHNANLTQWMASESNKAKVLGWLRNPKGFLLLAGSPGTGKTYFSVAIGNYLFDQKKDVKYLHIRDFLGMVKKTINDPSRDTLDYVRQIAETPILIIDDLGSTINTEWQIDMILTLVDIRYSDNKPTIITTNLSEKDMKEALGDRISRRIHGDESTAIYTDQR